MLVVSLVVKSYAKNAIIFMTVFQVSTACVCQKHLSCTCESCSGLIYIYYTSTEKKQPLNKASKKTYFSFFTFFMFQL